MALVRRIGAGGSFIRHIFIPSRYNPINFFAIVLFTQHDGIRAFCYIDAPFPPILDRIFFPHISFCNNIDQRSHKLLWPCPLRDMIFQDVSYPGPLISPKERDISKLLPVHGVHHVGLLCDDLLHGGLPTSDVLGLLGLLLRVCLHHPFQDDLIFPCHVLCFSQQALFAFFVGQKRASPGIPGLRFSCKAVIVFALHRKAPAAGKPFDVLYRVLYLVDKRCLCDITSEVRIE
nr:hypothetical protein [Fretibacterium fastidiosum]